jgi:peptidoglycan/LPS O-acetylase OafA/YrhL
LFGIFRFVLATFVLLNHVGILFWGVNPGPVAVIGFYIISGYVISYILDYRIKGKILKSFYAERFFRIYPQFLFHLIVSVMFILLTGHTIGMTETLPDWKSIATNLFLFPLQFKAFSGYLYSILYVPTSWSLSLEISFYLVAPIILKFRFLDLVAATSFGIFALAIFDFLPPSAHAYSYATIFGTLHFFILGTWLQRKQTKKIGIWVGAMILTSLAITFWGSWRPPHLDEVIIGGLFGILIIKFLAGYKNQHFKPIDDFLGRLSYPVFLNHFLFIWTFEWLDFPVQAFNIQIAILTMSWIFAWIAYRLVETPIDGFRRSLRFTGKV